MAEMFINGKATPALSGERDEIRNPATGRVIDTVPRAGAADVDKAAAAASLAFQRWSRLPAAERGRLMARAVSLLFERTDLLAPLLQQEQGKPMREARMEIHRFAHTLEHYAGLAKNLRGGSVPDLDTNRIGLILKRPIGVVGAIVPWNFPLSLLGNKLGPALIAGNTMVVKPAETTPLTNLLMAHLLLEAGIPEGVVNIVTGPGETVGAAIVDHPLIRKIGFTGSTSVGQLVAQRAGAQIKRVTLELGGSDPFLIADDADIDAAVSAASVGRFFNCGQACLAVKRLYVMAPVYDEVVEKLTAKVQRLRVGPGDAKGSMLGPLHSEAQRSEIEGQLADAVNRGGRILVGGSRPQGDGFDLGYFFQPTLVVDAPHDSRVATEETFGPLLPVWKVASWDEALQRANASPYGLGSSVWTRNSTRAMQAAERLEAGYTWVNAPSKIYDELPFGGVKMSGLGKEHGHEALDYYMESKAVVLRTSDEPLDSAVSG